MNENDFIVSKLSENAWLGINDGKSEGSWFIDPKEKGGPRFPINFSNWVEGAIVDNNDVDNSAYITKTGNWDIADRYFQSRFVCKKPAFNKITNQ